MLNTTFPPTNVLEAMPCVLDISMIFAFCACVLGLYFVSWKIKRKHLPPGPLCLPVIGSIFWFLQQRKRKRRIAHAFYAESERYGNVIYTGIGSNRLICLIGYKTIQETFVKRADIFSDRPGFLKGLKEPTKEGKGIIWQDRAEVKVLRKFTSQALRDFGVGKTSLEDNIYHEIDATIYHLDNASDEPVDITLLASKMITNIIYQIVFGKRYEYNDNAFETLLDRLNAMFMGGGSLDPIASIPKTIIKLMHRTKYNQMEHLAETVLWIKDHIYKEIESHESTYDKDNIRDFIDLYIQTKSEEIEKDVFIVGNSFRIIIDLFLAGSETTSNAISWSILYMMEYPDVQQKCQDEIHEKCGDRRVQSSDKVDLPFVEGTLLEVLRLSNIAPLSLPHCNSEDTTINGYKIPKHSLLVANLYSANMDPTHWDQPEVFDPDRFIDENGKIKKHPSFIPFSLGPRVCIGDSLAKTEMFLIFTNLLQRYTFNREHEDIPHTFDSVYDKSVSTPTAYKTRAIKRS